MSQEYLFLEYVLFGYETVRLDSIDTQENHLVDILRQPFLEELLNYKIIEGDRSYNYPDSLGGK